MDEKTNTARFWNHYSSENSPLLWMPTDDCAEQQPLEKYMNIFYGGKVPVTYAFPPTTHHPPQPIVPMPLETPPNTTYTRKIRFYPNQEQKELFWKCINCSRYLWNKGVEYVRTHTGSYSAITLRKACLVPNKELVLPENAHLLWQKKIPYDTRDGVFRQMESNIKTCFTQRTKGQINRFNLQFKTKKARRHTFAVSNKTFNLQTFRLFPDSLKKNSSLRVRRRKAREIRELSKIGNFTISTEAGRWYLNLPTKRPSETVPTQPFTSVALDPGVRTFQTFYSPDGIAGKIGEGLVDTVSRLRKREQQLQSLQVTSLYGQVRKRQRQNISRRRKRMRTKASSVVRDVHWKTCDFLTRHFKTILLPTFGVQKMVSTDRGLSTETRARMMSLSHFEFKERLRFKCLERGVELQEVSEAWTSKTCGGCDTVNNELGSAREFVCLVCPFQMDRDYNGARNIWIRTLGSRMRLHA